MAASSSTKMLGLYILTVFLTLNLASAGPALMITHTPDYVRFKKTASQVPVSEIDSIISSSFGHSLKKDLKWKGLEQGSLFHRPKANVLFSLEGVQDINVEHIAKYPVDTDEMVINTPKVVNRLEDRPNGDKSIVVDFAENNVFDVQSRHPKLLSSLPGTLDDVKEHLIGEGSAFAKLGFGALNVTRDLDLAFLAELQVMHEVLNKVKSDRESVKDNIPDLYHFRLTSMNRLSQNYGVHSQPVLDAHRLLNALINKLTAEFKDLYDGHVVIEIVTLPGVDSAKLIRKTRSLMADPQPVAIAEMLNVAAEWRNYAAIFNIILWTVIFMVIVVGFVSYSMWTMDPGRDSIIYRMTSQRIKKD